MWQSVTRGPRFGRIPFLGSYKRGPTRLRSIYSQHTFHMLQDCAANRTTHATQPCHTPVLCRKVSSNLLTLTRHLYGHTNPLQTSQVPNISQHLIRSFRKVLDTKNWWKLTPKCQGMPNIAEVTAYLEAPKLVHNSQPQNPTQLTSNANVGKHNSCYTVLTLY
jgi:hypothetical protein